MKQYLHCMIDLNYFQNMMIYLVFLSGLERLRSFDDYSLEKKSLDLEKFLKYDMRFDICKTTSAKRVGELAF